jgi:3-hydroxyisobutyrate dehydrogenase
VSAISTIAFVGLGNIGFPMVRNLLKAGFSVRTFDLSADAVAATERDGAKAALTMRDAVANVDCVFTMLPMGHDVEAVFRGDEGLLAMTRSGALLVDSSTISSAISRALSVEAKPAATYARCAGLRRDPRRACRDPHIHRGRRRS